ncbi:DUF2634 domain-containing protein [Aminipila terrae]|uniref:DUF2634 domain-containing protein n=1 Tax=Aminipila terrae TaxID=2697030 RepID=A0A6P1M9R9_9FIRM|nr:DUF2634 domain-containing protein [Aminipila terrae]QHI71459.1 DUF2634 domain-containing protein [Aminipila terrae]
MFPEVKEFITTQENARTKMGKSFLFDFDSGDFTVVDGKVVECEGIEAVKVWIKKILFTEKNRFKIYESGEYGVSLKDFISGDYPAVFAEIEIEREIKEALLKNVDITAVHTFNFKKNGRTLNCSFTAETIYGTTGGEITI